MKTYTLDDITCVIFNWMASRMTIGAIKNFKKFYPNIHILVIDDGSPSDRGFSVWNAAYNKRPDNAGEKLDRDLAKLKEVKDIELVEFPDHMGHGMTIDRALPFVKTDLMLTMDNDIRIQEPGLIEEYLAKYNEDPENIYAVGTQTTKDFMGKDGPYFYSWCDPWFTIWNMKPLRNYPRVSFAEMFTPGRNQFGASCMISMFLEFPEIHRPHDAYKAVFFPPPEAQPKLWHLKKDPDDQGLAKEMWDKLLDG